MLKRFIPLVLLAGIISIAVVACGGGAAAPTATPQPASPPPPPAARTPTVATATPAGQPTPPPGGGGTEVSVALQDPGGSGSYRFQPSQFNFNVGDTITFKLTAEREFHTFTVDDLGIDVEVDPGQTVTHTYTFEQPGTFELICIPHEALGMVGIITVQ